MSGDKNGSWGEIGREMVLSQFSALGGKIDALSAKLDAQSRHTEAKIDNHARRITVIETRVKVWSGLIGFGAAIVGGVVTAIIAAAF